MTVGERAGKNKVFKAHYRGTLGSAYNCLLNFSLSFAFNSILLLKKYLNSTQKKMTNSHNKYDSFVDNILNK